MYDWMSSATARFLEVFQSNSSVSPKGSRRSRRPIKWGVLASALLDSIVTWFSTCSRTEVVLVATNLVLYNVLPFKVALFCQPAAFCALCYRDRALDMSLFRAVAIAGFSRIIVTAGYTLLECLCVCIIGIIGIGITRSLLVPGPVLTPAVKRLTKAPRKSSKKSLKDLFVIEEEMSLSSHVENAGCDRPNDKVS